MTALPAPPAPAPPEAGPLRGVGTVVVLLASALQVLSAFHRWDPERGRIALDVLLVADGRPVLSVGTALLLLAALPALAALVTPRGGVRVLSAVGTAALVLAWVALGPVAPMAAGVWLATGAVCAHLVAAALAP